MHQIELRGKFCLGDLEMLTGNSIQNTSVSSHHMSDGVSARTIILGNRAPGTCMSSYRCHGPGTASDRARMKTFSFRLGDLDGNAYDIHRTSDVYMSVIRKCIRSSSDEC